MFFEKKCRKYNVINIKKTVQKIVYKMKENEKSLRGHCRVSRLPPPLSTPVLLMFPLRKLDNWPLLGIKKGLSVFRSDFT